MNQAPPSPAYASLRAVVRPAIVARELLLRQEEQTAPLVYEAKQLLAATEELLHKIGLAHSYGGSGIRHVAACGVESRADVIARSYAAAGLAWSELTATTMVFATKLIEEGNTSEAKRLARSLEELGEPTLGADLQRRIDEAAERDMDAALQRRLHEVQAIPYYEVTTAIRSILEILDEGVDPTGRRGLFAILSIGFLGSRTLTCGTHATITDSTTLPYHFRCGTIILVS